MDEFFHESKSWEPDSVTHGLRMKEISRKSVLLNVCFTCDDDLNLKIVGRSVGKLDLAYRCVFSVVESFDSVPMKVRTVNLSHFKWGE